MDVYRIHRREHDALDGTGAALVGGRWNPVGTPVVYAALTFEGAILEQLVHANIGKLPGNRVASRIHIPDEFNVQSSHVADHPKWLQESVSQGLGRDWLISAEGIVMLVPSVVARPWSWNVLINPRHPDFPRLSVVESVDVVWDPRLTSGNVE